MVECLGLQPSLRLSLWLLAVHLYLMNDRYEAGMGSFLNDHKRPVKGLSNQYGYSTIVRHAGVVSGIEYPCQVEESIDSVFIKDLSYLWVSYVHTEMTEFS